MAHLNGPAAKGIAERVLNGLLETDFSKGRAFYQKLTPELRRQSAGRYAAAWAKEEPAAARRDACTQEFVREIVDIDPESALSSANAI